MNHGLKMLLQDMLSTFVFLGVFAITGNPVLTVAASIGVGLAQIAFEKLRRRPIPTMQGLSMVLVLVFGTASLLTQDPRFIMIKPTIIGSAVAAVMLKPGWLDRYLPEIVHRNVPKSVIFASGYGWALVNFAVAMGNLYVVYHYDRVVWAAYNSSASLIANFSGFAIQYVVFRTIVARKLRRDAQHGVAA